MAALLIFQLYFSVWGVYGHMLSDVNTTSMTVNEAKKIQKKKYAENAHVFHFEVSGGLKRSLSIERAKNSVGPTINSCISSINYLKFIANFSILTCEEN